MADLANAGARPRVDWLRQENARLRRELATLRSSNRPLARGTFGPDTIPASALREPAAPGLLSATLSGVGIPAAGAVLLEQTFTVPPRMTTATIYAHARVFAMNGSTTAGGLLVRAEVDEFLGNAVPVAAAVGAGAVNASPLPVLLTGLVVGQTVSTRVWAMASNADWPADPANLVELTGSIAWFA